MRMKEAFHSLCQLDLQVISLYNWSNTVSLLIIPPPLLLLKDHSNFVNCVRFSPDGERFVTAGADGQVSVSLLSVWTNENV